jgi:hypothetical protein
MIVAGVAGLTEGSMERKTRNANYDARSAIAAA